MPNLLERFRALIPKTPLLVGTVLASTGDQHTLQTDDGALHVARGTALVADRVYFRPGGSIEGDAPALTVVPIDI